MKKYVFIIICLLMCLCHIKAQETEKDSKFKLSFSERVRLTTIDKAITLDKDKDVLTFTRWRTYLGAEYTPNTHLGMKLELGNEARIWMSPSSRKTTLDEIFVNQLYINYQNVANLPLDIRLGRQNIMLDEGFICIDGNPLVGSRSNYFNALKTVCRFNDRNKLTAFFTYNTRKEEFLPILHEKDPYLPLEEQTNSGLGVHHHAKIKQLDWSTYYFYKNYLKYDALPEAHTHTVGTRLSLPFLNGFSFTTEFAYQLGKVDRFNRQSYGGYSRLDYKLGGSVPLLDCISAGAFYLSGDDPKTEKIEGWDPLWSRWPKWSESYVYTLIAENKGKAGYWSNINAINLGFGATLASNVKFNADYLHLSAPQPNETAFCSGGGKTRGNLFIMKLSYQIHKNWTGHFLFEHFTPGNFYFNGADPYNWARFELKYTL